MFVRISEATLVLIVAAIGFWPTGVQAHDASAWGGLFRSGDGGLSWFQASSGKVMGGALALAVDPTDSADLLLGTDSGMLRSRNGGRDWDLVASSILMEPVLAVSFDSDGHSMLGATATVLAESDDGLTWRTRALPINASPARELLPDRGPGVFYLVGWRALYRTDDAGTTWSELGSDLPGPVTHLVVRGDAPAQLYALSAGEIWLSRDGGRVWESRNSGLPPGGVQTLSFAHDYPDALWAAATNRLFVANASLETWTATGSPLPDADTQIRGIVARVVADTEHIVLSTDRGLYSSSDAGATWNLLVDNLPGHIEAGPLVVAAGQITAVYAGFSVTPYDELWQTAASGGNSLARLRASEIVGAAALLTVVALGAGLILRWLAGR